MRYLYDVYFIDIHWKLGQLCNVILDTKNNPKNSQDYVSI